MGQKYQTITKIKRNDNKITFIASRMLKKFSRLFYDVLFIIVIVAFAIVHYCYSTELNILSVQSEKTTVILGAVAAILMCANIEKCATKHAVFS